MLCGSQSSGGRNGGRVIFHGSSSQGRCLREEFKTQCKFCLACEGELRQVCLAVEAFTFVGCMSCGFSAGFLASVTLF